MWGHLLQLIPIPEQIWTISGSPCLTITAEAGLKPASTNTNMPCTRLGTITQASKHATICSNLFHFRSKSGQ